ncbi:MAG: DUF349 domain-containing protein [Bacteroidetes bacterium]|nr:DUF349 domain-containing protein [Bacteroidota bacterium]
MTNESTQNGEETVTNNANENIEEVPMQMEESVVEVENHEHHVHTLKDDIQELEHFLDEHPDNPEFQEQIMLLETMENEIEALEDVVIAEETETIPEVMEETVEEFIAETEEAPAVDEPIESLIEDSVVMIEETKIEIEEAPEAVVEEVATLEEENIIIDEPIVADATEEDHGILEHEEVEGMPKKDLLRIIQEALHYPESKNINTKVTNARNEFFRIIEEEKLAAKGKFMALEGSVETDFTFPSDPLTREVNEAFRAFKNKRAEYINDLNKKKDINLEMKKGMLESLRELVEGTETQNSLEEVRRIQDEWKKIGHVPLTEVEGLWNKYNHYINKFYDQFSLYSEFKDLDRKRNMDAKREMVAKIEGLEKVESITEALNLLRQYQEDWKHIGPVPKEMLEEIIVPYRAALARIFERRDNFNVEVQAKLQQNLEAKTEILNKIQEIANFTATKANDWVAKNVELGQWVEKWRAIGALPNDKRAEYKDALSTAVKNFNKAKNEFFRVMKKEKGDNLRKKIALCEKIEALLTEADLNSHRKTVIDMQEEWKKIGAIPPNFSDKIWKRFREACDLFFAKINEEFKERDKELVINLEKKVAMLDRLEELTEQEEVGDVESHIKQAQEEWASIGFVPFRDKDKIIKRYYKVLNNLAAKNKNAAKSAELLSYKIMVQSWGGDADSGKRINQEEKRLVFELKKYETEIDTLQNNMEFLSKSKTADSLKQSLERQIEKMKEKMKAIKEKLSIAKTVDMK